MQGTAADLIKMAMVAVQDWTIADGLRSLMVMQVHDELVFDAAPDEVDLLRERVPRLMAGVAELAVPLVAEVGVGHDWGEAH
jgi:DNA polymerase-1